MHLQSCYWLIIYIVHSNVFGFFPKMAQAYRFGVVSDYVESNFIVLDYIFIKNSLSFPNAASLPLCLLLIPLFKSNIIHQTSYFQYLQLSDNTPPFPDIRPPSLDIPPPTTDIYPPLAHIPPLYLDISPPILDITPPSSDILPPSLDIAPPTSDIRPPSPELQFQSSIFSIP